MALPDIPKFSYDDPTPPQRYSCQTCGVTGIRLFREYYTMGDCTSLTCAACLLAAHIGWHLSEPHGGVIGPWVSDNYSFGRPGEVETKWIQALPAEEGDSWWNAGGAPALAYVRWNLLPGAIGAPRCPENMRATILYIARMSDEYKRHLREALDLRRDMGRR